MASSISRPMAPPLSDPFSAAHKAHPGQLPCFSLDHYHSPPHLEKRTKAEEHSRRQAARRASLSNSSAGMSSLPHPSPTRPSHRRVFSPALAGERDRELRRRIQSSPVGDLALAIGHATPNALPIDSDDEDDLSWLGDDPVPSSDYKLEPRKLFTTPHCPESSAGFKPRPGIFFSPPRGLDTACAVNGRRNSMSDRELELSRESSDDRFMMAISSAVSRGDSVVDLDNRGICSIPVLSSTRYGRGSRTNVPRALAASNLFQQLLTPLPSRSGMTRVRSAPTVSFGPTSSVSLYLSNNYLGSASSSSLERLGALRGLQRLSLRANQLREIPAGLLEGLTSLVELNLTNNKLCWLPSAVTQLDHCKIYVSGNPWLKRPPEAAEALRYVSPLVKTSPLLPTLVELCLRRICVLPGHTPHSAESIRPSPCPELSTSLWPAPEKIKRTLRAPQKELLNCCCGRWVCRLPVERFEWRQVGSSKSVQEIVPVRWTGCTEDCLRVLDDGGHSC